MTDSELFPGSLCRFCDKHRITVTARGSKFIRCSDPRLPKYRSQPVTDCPRFEPIAGPRAGPRADTEPAD